MSIKGLRINKKIAKKIYAKIDELTVKDIQGLDVFNSFAWTGFDLEEFKKILSLFITLVNQGFFENVDDHYQFVFNFSNEVTEMDIVTVLSNGEEKVLIDIEIKNGEDVDILSSKIRSQIEKRIKEYLPQLLKNKSYISVGFVNNAFVCGHYFDGEKLSDINNLEEFLNYTNRLSESNGFDEYLIQSSNLASIVKVCNDIKNNVYKYYQDTNKTYDLLVSKIDTHDVFVVYGNAGTGKSILALKLFFEMENTKILLLNSKLYYAMGLSQYYFSGKATFKTNAFIGSIDKDTISIVDECQRIPIEEIAEIIKKSKCTFLFGDQKQAFYRRSTLLPCKELAEKLEEQYGFKTFHKVIKKAKRYSDDVAKALSLLTSFNPDPNGCKLPKDYEINLFYDENDFLKKYKETTGIKKIYMPLNESPFNVRIGEETFERVRYDYDNFSVMSLEGNFYGTTYHALSFDIDHCFVYLRTTRIINYNKSNIPYFDNRWVDNPTFLDIQLYLNELNILFTRGKKSLNIYVDDIKTYLYFNKLINKIK